MATSRYIEIFYDGSCRVCDREMAYYRERDSSGIFKFIDIAAPGFEAHLHGRQKGELMARLHVRDKDGNFHTGVDGFAVIWDALPGEHLTWLATLVRLPGMHAVASLGYELFARVRPWLPKNRRECDGDNCRWGHPHPR